MPWHIKRKGAQYCVHEGRSGSGGAEVTCHPSKAKAQAHMRALYANEPEAAEWLTEMDYLVAQFEEMNTFGFDAVVITDAAGAERPLNVQVANTPETRALGMVGRDFDGFDALLFVYDTEVEHPFHMGGVPVDLLIAWYDADGYCFEVTRMLSMSATQHKPTKPYRWALEVPASDENFAWLAGSRITVGGGN